MEDALAPPPLHGAIVERLRARMELCRRHHSACERRYRRGLVESADREHANTLHLLSLAQQATSGRRGAKGGRGASQQQQQQQPDAASRTGPDAKDALEGESKSLTRMALQGSLRRKLEGHAAEYNPNQSRLPGGAAHSAYKRIRTEEEGLRESVCSYNLTGKENDLFSLTLKEMKKEPGESQPCGRPPGDVSSAYDCGGGHLDPELQDLFEELTRSVPSFNDQDLEKILKQDVTFGLDSEHPTSENCSILDKVIKTEYPPELPTDAPRCKQESQCSGGWMEISHAEQLKQMAANQQPVTMFHHHHQHHPQQQLTSNWSTSTRGISQQGSAHFQKPHLPIPAPPCLQKNQPSKRTISQLHFKLAPQRQDKLSMQEHPSRHLTQPPPDYKASRGNMFELSQPNYTGMTSEQVGFPMNSGHISTAHTAKLAPPSSGADSRLEVGGNSSGWALALAPRRLSHPPHMQHFPESRRLALTGRNAYESPQAGSLTLDFLPEGDNVVPAINAESDFIESLLKSGPSSDDWMKDINLDEILGSHT